MKYYKDNNNNVYAYELDGSQDELIGDKVALTAQEVEAHINPAKTYEQLQAEIKQNAQTALDKTDLVAIRCLKAGVTFPAAWKTYTTALRDIVSGADTTSTALPTMPNYPAGT